MKYVLAAPVRNGSAFWEISDRKTDYPVVTIHESFPNAAKIIREILERANQQSGE